MWLNQEEKEGYIKRLLTGIAIHWKICFFQKLGMKNMRYK